MRTKCGVLVDLADDRKAIENKWMFKKKTDTDGDATIYKARLVAKGFRQVQGVDYDETFSRVAMLKSVRIMLAIVTFYDYEIWQMDVKTAFLNGFLKEQLYMIQPEGFVDPKGANKVCKPQRSIYGLVQASRSWNKHLSCYKEINNNFIIASRDISFTYASQRVRRSHRSRLLELVENLSQQVELCRE